MELDLGGLAQKDRYKLLTALVVPRPIAWITTIDASGRTNAAPYSFFNVMGNRPPIVAFGPGDKPSGEPKDTARNIEETREFVVNLVDPSCAAEMHASAAAYPAGLSEIDELGLKTLPSKVVGPPRLAVTKVQLECTLWGTVEIEDNRVVFGVVRHLHADDGIIDPSNYRLNPGTFEGIGRLQGPGTYCTSADRFDLGGFPKLEASKSD